MIAVAYAASGDVVASSENYQLDQDKATAYNIKKDQINSAENTTQTDKAINNPTPKIITEEIAGGRIEKLLDQADRVIAEKTITNDKITNKTLYYYYPTGQLMRKIVASDDGSGFYAEEYYNNGKIAEQATFINEGNRIGIEKKYDTTGVLRQEIPWVLPKDEINKPIAERKSIRYGNVVTYYPNGAKAAVFSVGKNGNNTFYNQQGTVIKEIPDNQILSFHQELNEEDCQGATIHLDLQSLVELYEDEGDISYNKCGLPYRENFMYEIKDKTDNKAIMLSYDDIGMIRRITPYNNGLKEGLMQKFDAAGNLTAEINYRQGVKDGVARGYFPTKETAFQKHYVNGKVEGDLICYFPNGEIAAKFHYQNGLKEY